MLNRTCWAAKRTSSNSRLRGQLLIASVEKVQVCNRLLLLVRTITMSTVSLPLTAAQNTAQTTIVVDGVRYITHFFKVC